MVDGRVNNVKAVIVHLILQTFRKKTYRKLN
jgi:hypothetical protein